MLSSNVPNKLGLCSALFIYLFLNLSSPWNNIWTKNDNWTKNDESLKYFQCSTWGKNVATRNAKNNIDFSLLGKYRNFPKICTTI